MAYVKHHEHGNKHVPDDEVESLQALGWVKWPRTKEQKATLHVVLSVEELSFPFPLGEPVSAPAEPRQKRKYTRKA